MRMYLSLHGMAWQKIFSPHCPRSFLRGRRLLALIQAGIDQTADELRIHIEKVIHHRLQLDRKRARIGNIYREVFVGTRACELG